MTSLYLCKAPIPKPGRILRSRGVRMPAYLCSGDATQPMTPVRSPSILTGSLRPAAVEGRRKRSQNTCFLTPPSGTCDGHTLWATWRPGSLGKQGAVSPRADALRTPSGPPESGARHPPGSRSSGPPQASRGRRRHRVSACGRQPLPVSSLTFAAVAITCVTPATGPGSPPVTRRTTFEAFGKMANSLAAYPLSGTLSPRTPKSCLLHGPPCSGRLQ